MHNKAPVNSDGNSRLDHTLQQVKSALSEDGIEGFETEARLLACHALEINSLELITRFSQPVETHEIARLKQVLARRLAGEPVGRIVGGKEFFGRFFHLCTDTLEPRSDTEILVAAILDDYVSLQEMKSNQAIRILELGTGTGIITVSLVANIPGSIATATDISAKALTTAQKNATAHKVEDRISFRKSSWCENIKGKFDIIVSNPPYIRSKIIPTLAPQVRYHDPMVALDGGEDGLEAYRQIFKQSVRKMSEQSRLYLEIGYDQSEQVQCLAGQNNFKLIRCEKDMSANDRVLVFDKS